MAVPQRVRSVTWLRHSMCPPHQSPSEKKAAKCLQRNAPRLSLGGSSVADVILSMLKSAGMRSVPLSNNGCLGSNVRTRHLFTTQRTVNMVHVVNKSKLSAFWLTFHTCQTIVTSPRFISTFADAPSVEESSLCLPSTNPNTSAGKMQPKEVPPAGESSPSNR